MPIRRPPTTGRRALPVLNEDGELTGIITQTDLSRALRANAVERPVSEYATRELITTHPEQTLDEAVGKLTEVNQMPVVERHDPKRLVGMLTPVGILKARRIEMEKGID